MKATHTLVTPGENTESKKVRPEEPRLTAHTLEDWLEYFGITAKDFGKLRTFFVRKTLSNTKSHALILLRGDGKEIRASIKRIRETHIYLDGKLLSLSKEIQDFMWTEMAVEKLPRSEYIIITEYFRAEKDLNVDEQRKVWNDIRTTDDSTKKWFYFYDRGGSTRKSWGLKKQQKEEFDALYIIKKQEFLYRRVAIKKEQYERAHTNSHPSGLRWESELEEAGLYNIPANNEVL